MIKQKIKECKDCGWTTQLWSGGRCKPCDSRFKASMRTFKPLSPLKGSKSPLKPLTPSHSINKKSKRRIEEEVEYRKLVAKMELVKRKQCFFCGSEILGKKWDPHHLDGRDEHYLTPGLLVHSHRRCHMEYHDVSAKKIGWFYGYLERIRMKGEMLYEREKMKLDK